LAQIVAIDSSTLFSKATPVRVIVTIALSLFFVIAQADILHPDSTDAAKFVSSRKAAIEGLQKRFDSAVGSKRYHYFKAAEFIWLSENADVIYAANKILDGRTDKIGASQEIISSSETPNACVTLSRKIFAGSESIQATAPKAFSVLTDYLTKHPVPEEIWAERETKVGCMKRGLNDGNNVDAIAGYCGCIGSEFVKTTSASQRKAYWKAIEDKDQEEINIWVKTITPFAMKCKTP